MFNSALERVKLHQTFRKIMCVAQSPRLIKKKLVLHLFTRSDILETFWLSYEHKLCITCNFGCNSIIINSKSPTCDCSKLKKVSAATFNIFFPVFTFERQYRVMRKLSHRVKDEKVRTWSWTTTRKKKLNLCEMVKLLQNIWKTKFLERNFTKIAWNLHAY